MVEHMHTITIRETLDMFACRILCTVPINIFPAVLRIIPLGSQISGCLGQRWQRGDPDIVR